MAYSIEDLVRIDEAIAKLQMGERVEQVAHDGHVVRYSGVDLGDLIKFRNRMKAEVKGAGVGYKRRVLVVSSKGGG